MHLSLDLLSEVGDLLEIGAKIGEIHGMHLVSSGIKNGILNMNKIY